MSRASKLSAVILACALTRAAAVELEGPAGTPAPTPVPLAPAGLAPIVVPAIDPLQTPVGLDAALSGNVIPEAAEDGALPRAAATAASASAKTATASVEAQARSARAKTTASVTRISDHVAKAAEAAGKADATGEDRAGATRSIERELTGERETPSDDYASVYLRGVADGSIPTGPRLERAAKPGEYRARTGYNVLYGTREELVNPGHVYAEAYYAASFAAQKMGLPGRVFFVEVTGSLPLRGGDHAHFTFVPAGPQAKPSVIYVDFKRSLTTLHGDFDVRTSVHAGVDVKPRLWPDLDDPAGYGFVARGFERGPQTAFQEARRDVPGFAAKGGASFSARLEKDETTGDVDVWYKLYDDAGAVVAVNARTLETRALKAPAPAKPPVDWAAVVRHSGPLALIGAFGLALWFMIAYGLSGELGFSLRLVRPLAALVTLGVAADVWDALSRFRRKK